MRRWASRAVLGAAAVAAIAVLASSGRAVCRGSAFFLVRQVEVVGAAHVEVDTVLAALGLGRDAHVCDDLDAAEARVSAIPGVAEARVGRRLPGTVRVAVVEVLPVAFVPGPRGLGAVGVDGQALAFDPALAPLDLPIAASADRELLGVLARIQLVDPALARQIAEARLARRVAILDLGGARILVRPDVTAPTLRTVALVAADLEARGRRYRELDARFEGQVVVRLAGER